MLNNNQVQCTATAKSTGQQCKNPAVSGGDKCRLHGGKTPRGEHSPHFKTGVYSKYQKYLPDSVREKAASFSSDDPLDLLGELQTQRAIVADFISDRKKLGENEVGMIMNLMDMIGRMVERITKMRNQTALTGAEVQFLQMRAVDLAMEYFDDAETQREFVQRLFSADKQNRLK